MGYGSNIKTMRCFYKPFIPEFEPHSSESETIPDESLTVRDILSRFVRGSMLVPPVEQGDDDDIDQDDQFDDLVDAFDSVNSGYALAQSLSAAHDAETPPSSSDSSPADVAE